MTPKGGKDQPKSARDSRLADALRANLHRRKAQARSRRDGEADARAGLLAHGGDAPAAGRDGVNEG